MQCTVVRQLSVAIENQPGRLAAMGRLLADHGINIRDLTVVDNVEQGMIRVVLDDAESGRRRLQEQGLHVVEAEVLVMILKDTPGQLARISQALADAGINIDYAYGTEDAAGAEIRMVLKVSNTQEAARVIVGLEQDQGHG